MAIVKVCKIHGELTIEEVNIQNPRKPNHRKTYMCKQCTAIRNKEYYKNNKQNIIKNVEEWRANNPDKVKEFYAKYNNKDERKSMMREYYLLNKDSIHARQNDYYKIPEVKERYKERLKRKQSQRKLLAYGLDEDDYNSMLKKQNNVCAICKDQESAFDSRLKVFKSLAIDHDHNTGKVRELLCSKCNLTIGRVGEDINLLQSMIDYIKKHQIE